MLALLVFWVFFRGVVFTGFRFENISIVVIQIVNPLVISVIPIALVRMRYFHGFWRAFKSTLIALMAGEILSCSVYFVFFGHFIWGDATGRYIASLSILAQLALVIFIYALTRACKLNCVTAH